MADKSEDRIDRIKQQMDLLQSQIGEIQEEDVVKIPWHPRRGEKNAVQLSDGSFITGLPEVVTEETDPQARIVLAIFGELLTLRDEVIALRKQVGGQRADMTGSPELAGEAAAFKDGVVATAEKANTSAAPQ